MIARLWLLLAEIERLARRWQSQHRVLMEGWTEDGQLAHAGPSCGETTLLSINSGTDWAKCVWREVIEAEAVAIFGNDNVVEKGSSGRGKIAE